MTVSCSKPHVYFRCGLWFYAGFNAPTIPDLIKLVRAFTPPPPKNPIFRYSE